MPKIANRTVPYIVVERREEIATIYEDEGAELSMIRAAFIAAADYAESCTERDDNPVNITFDANGHRFSITVDRLI